MPTRAEKGASTPSNRTTLLTSATPLAARLGPESRDALRTGLTRHGLRQICCRKSTGKRVGARINPETDSRRGAEDQGYRNTTPALGIKGTQAISVGAEYQLTRHVNAFVAVADDTDDLKIGRIGLNYGW